jgi:hypothetical protein
MAAAFLVAALCACSTHRIACIGPPIRPPALFPVFPIPNSTAVPDAPQFVVVEELVSNSDLSGVKFTLTPPTGPAVVIGPVGPAPSPLPTPNQTVGLSAGAQFLAVTVPTLAAHTTYQVIVTANEPNVDVCGGQVSAGWTFTTQ